MITLKSTFDLSKKGFFNEKDNKYRVKKLIKMNEILKNSDYDIELDDLRYLKLNKYKEYPLVKVNKAELKKLLPNYDLKEESFLPFLGINKIEGEADKYSLQLDIYLDKFIRINLKELTFEENFEVIYKMLDKGNKGRIMKSDFTDLLTFFHNSSQLNFEQKTLELIISSAYSAIDQNNSGSISKSQLQNYLQKYRDEDISINPFTKIKSAIPVTKLRKGGTIVQKQYDANVLERVKRKKHRSKLQKFWFLNKKMIIWTGIYIVLCLIAGFTNRGLEGGRQYTTTKAARFFAGIMYFNLALLILFICNTFTTFLSSFNVLRMYLPLGDTKFYHAVCATVMGICTIPHILIHIFGDFKQIARLTAKKPKDAYVTVAWLTFANLTGITGVFCTLLFGALFIIPHIRPIMQKNYEIFLLTHKLFYPAVIVLFLHGRTPDTKRWPYVYFLSLPLFILLIELLVRLFRYFKNKTKIAHIKTLPSGVLLLEVERPEGFTFRCGQYCQLLIPKISKTQWHPFTIASSPYDKNLYFYISPVGDWTKDLQKISIDGKKNSKYLYKCYCLFR